MASPPSLFKTTLQPKRPRCMHQRRGRPPKSASSTQASVNHKTVVVPKPSPADAQPALLSQTPSLVLHLTVHALDPTLTSTRSRPQLDAFSSMTTTALIANNAATRFSLRFAQRVIVKHGPGSAAGHHGLLPQWCRRPPLPFILKGSIAPNMANMTRSTM
ncbi:hypothetical protein LY78DRAFT_687078 [Colletotrichum sublineola]|uniref:Uncharacterized protein n=1 Tax=Colletotrichum sublineola TaxID=1173701 RepID=A0A066WW79_COLSU|nr:hypothetical protein LY78DRAFT_687078 [Colletotrichum sublineola]KDN60952.1 hypothetical protein CSUB01_12001 [Colletotrichum sublineola]